MSGRRITLDTNILVYALDRRAGMRHVMAREIVAKASFIDCRLTLQSISEFFWVVSRKRLVPATDAADQARDWLALFPIITATESAMLVALGSAVSGQMAFWDALLVATAGEAGCTTILTEDLGNGSVMHGVRILNPFGAGRLAPEADALLSG